MNDNLRYPIGKYSPPPEVTEEHVRQWVRDIGDHPVHLADAVSDLSKEQLDTPYRPGGWTVRQVVHHLGDSHLNSVIRFKWGLTEQEPVIKTYEEAAWALLPDYTAFSVDEGVEFIAILHARWVALLRNLNPQQWDMKINHPDWGLVTLSQMAGIYSWHGRHHVAHIAELRSRNNW